MRLEAHSGGPNRSKWDTAIWGLLVSVYSLTLSVAAQARVIPVADHEGKPPIELKLSTTSMMVCIGSSIPLDLEMTNRGNDEIRIDRIDVWNRFEYGFLGDRDTDRGGGMSSGCSHCRGDLIVLKPDKPFESSFKFSLDSDFFKDAGKYIIKLTIEGVPSNELSFELFSCK